VSELINDSIVMKLMLQSTTYWSSYDEWILMNSFVVN